MEEIILQNKDGKILASSRDVADSFEKAHKDVLKSIRNLIKNNPELSVHFMKSTYKSNRNKIYPCY